MSPRGKSAATTRKPADKAAKKATKPKEKPAPKKKSKDAKQVEALKKELETARAQLRVKRNSEMLDAEEDDAPPPKKVRPRRTPDAADDTDPNSATEEKSEDEHGLDESASRAGTPSTPDEDEMVVDDGPNAQKTRRGSKHRTGSRVTQATAVRVRIATEQAFPAEHREWSMETLKKAVSQDKTLSQRLAKSDEDNERKVLTYAWAGAPQVRSEVKALCVAAVSLFGIPGTHTQSEIRDIIEWLTSKQAIFKYGEVDVVARTYNKQKPFGHPFYQDVITKQWFSSAKSEGVRRTSMDQYVDLNIPLFALVTDAMESSLKEYATGVRIGNRFTEDEYADRYEHHQMTLRNLEAQSPQWFANFRHEIYSRIVQATQFKHLKKIVNEQDAEDLDGVDFAALEASVSAV
ncbi:hypothetical protein C8F04DRAFT_1164283 [Mycena alexandri]|uniref:DUF6532 domain-containing protein n=1 Tax=Mycena alexandri TaxID=1745969 RepID=A0AAD6WM17_9AGAR|nr:hypothetical protein C8F04DRAFT_1164283 [Mycena alexandri]